MRMRFWIAVVTCGLSCAVAAPAQAYVYWSVQNSPAIARADQDGSAVNHSLVSDSNVGQIAIDGSHIYWANPTTNSIGRANLDGGGANPAFIQNTSDSTHHPSFMAVDSSHIYWTDGSRYIGRANLDGTGANAQWADDGAGNDPNGITVSQGNVYFVDLNHFQVIPSGGTTPQSLALIPANTLMLGITAAGGYIYYAGYKTVGSPPNGLIGRVQISNGAVPDNTFITGLDGPSGVAVDGQEIYWTDFAANTIGRAPLSNTSAAQDNWITEPATPLDIKVNDNVDPTQTSVSCSPSTVSPGTAATCTATVSDGASSSPPSGVVSFSSNASTFFSGSNSSCTLSPSTRSCTVGAVSTQAGTVPITADYAGDSLHQSSSGSGAFCSGSTTQCGGGSGGGSSSGGGGSGGGGSGGGGSSGGGSSGGGATPRCVVPKLKGKTLAQARKLLARAHCKLGKVRRQKVKKHHKPLVITSQQLAPGTRMPAGTNVGIHLKLPPKHRRH